MQFLLVFGTENFSRLTRHPLLSFHYFYFQDTLSGSSAFLFLALCSLGSSHHGLTPRPLLQAPITCLGTSLVKVDPNCPAQQKPSTVPTATCKPGKYHWLPFPYPHKRLPGFFPLWTFRCFPSVERFPLAAPSKLQGATSSCFNEISSSLLLHTMAVCHWCQDKGLKT